MYPGAQYLLGENPKVVFGPIYNFKSGQGIILKGKYRCTVDLLFDWFGLFCFAYINKNVCCHTADSKPVQQEVNRTVILPPLVFPGRAVLLRNMHGMRTTISKAVNVVMPNVVMLNVVAPFVA